MRHRLASVLSIMLIPIACGQMNAQHGAASSADEVAGRIEGVASVIDGDTIEIHGQRLRLSGFDSPESGKRCGGTNVYQQAAIYLSDRIGRKTVTCAVTGKSYDRAVAICSVDGTDLGTIMVSAGWARDWPKYSHGTYAGAEADARASRQGIWNLECPEDLWGDRSYQ